jgi:hypothetical protein
VKIGFMLDQVVNLAPHHDDLVSKALSTSYQEE